MQLSKKLLIKESYLIPLIHNTICNDNREDPSTERIIHKDLMRERIFIRFIGIALNI